MGKLIISAAILLLLLALSVSAGEYSNYDTNSATYYLVQAANGSDATSINKGAYVGGNAGAWTTSNALLWNRTGANGNYLRYRPNETISSGTWAYYQDISYIGYADPASEFGLYQSTGFTRKCVAFFSPNTSTISKYGGGVIATGLGAPNTNVTLKITYDATADTCNYTAYNITTQTYFTNLTGQAPVSAGAITDLTQGFYGGDGNGNVKWNNIYLYRGTVRPNAPDAPPTISAVSAGTTTTTAQLNFTLSGTAGNWTVLYSANDTGGVGNGSASNSSYGTGPVTLDITGLTAYTTYNANITSCAASGGCSVYSTNFTTLTSNATIRINALNAFNESRIGGMSVNVSSGSYSFLTQTSGTAAVSVVVSPGVYNVTWGATSNFLGGQLEVNAENSTATYSANLTTYGLNLSVNASEAVTGTPLSAFNFSLSLQGGYTRNYSAITSTSILVPANVSGSINGSKSGYLAAPSASLAASLLLAPGSQASYVLNFSNANLSVNLKDFNTGAYISSFNATISQAAYSFSASSPSSAGNASFLIKQGLDYSVSIQAAGYGTVNATISSNATQQIVTLQTVQTNNSALIIYVYDEDTGLYISQLYENVSASIILASSQIAYNLTSANFTSVVILPGNYMDTHSASNYNPRNYYFTLANQSLSTISLYLLNSSRSAFFTVTVQDTNAIGVVNATVKVLRYYYGCNCYQIVNMFRTDQNGQGVIDLVPDTIDYEFIVEYAGRTVFTSIPTKYAEGQAISITVDISANFAGPITAISYVQTSLTYSNITDIVTFTWNNLRNTEVGAHLLVQKISVHTGITSICDRIINASAGSTSCDLSNQTGAVTARGNIIITNVDGSTQEIAVRSLDIDLSGQSKPSEVLGRSGAGYAVLLTLGLVSLGLFAPEIAILMAIGGIVLSVYLQLIDMGISSLIGLVIVGIVFMLRSQKRD